MKVSTPRDKPRRMGIDQRWRGQKEMLRMRKGKVRKKKNMLLKWVVVAVSKQPHKANEDNLLELSRSRVFLTIHHLKVFNRLHQLEIICLMETENGDAFCERTREYVGMNYT